MMRMRPSRFFVLCVTVCAVLLGTFASPQARGEDSVYVTDMKFALEELQKQCGHFFQLKDIDWKKVAREFQKEAGRVKNDGEHLKLLTRLLARVRDGHAYVKRLEKGKNVEWPDPVGERVGPGLAFCKIGKRIHVKHVWSTAESAGVQPGSQVLAIDGVPAAKWLDAKIAELSDLISYSTDHHAFFHACHAGLADKPGTRLKLDVKEPGGKRNKRTISYGRASARAQGAAFLWEGLQHQGDLSYGKTKRGNGYILIRRCKSTLPSQIDGALAAIGNVPGMILDFRSNTGGAFDHDALMGRFIPKGKEISFAKRYASAGATPYGGPVVVIVDGTVVSAGETASGIFKEDGRGYMIGESPTAGMSSSKTTIELPSGLFGLYVSIRSNKSRFNEGAGIEGIGVPPHEVVSYDARDLGKGIDTLIETAEARLAKPPRNAVPYNPSQFGWKKP